MQKFHHSISVTQFPLLITHNSSLITHHSSLNFSHSFGTITHFPSLNIFHTICGPYTCHSELFFFSNTQKLEPNERRKEKKKFKSLEPREKKKTKQKQKQKPWRRNQTQKKKGKKKVKRCGWVMTSGSHVYLITKMLLSYRNWKQLKCVFSFHNS